ncbi:MAG: porin family protein [Bacteroidota bacterium]
MKRFFLLVSGFFALQNNASAQLSISPEAGYQMSKVRYEIAGKEDNGDFKSGLRFGANLGLGVSDHLILQGGAFFSGKGGDINMLGFDVSRTFNYIDIPVVLNYMTGVATGSRFFIGAGPYWSYAIGGNNKALGTKTDVEIGSNAATDDIRPMDFGINANIGFLLSGGFYVRGMYAHGLTNILPGGDSDNSMRNSSLSLSLGYNFTF